MNDDRNGTQYSHVTVPRDQTVESDPTVLYVAGE